VQVSYSGTIRKSRRWGPDLTRQKEGDLDVKKKCGTGKRAYRNPSKKRGVTGNGKMAKGGGRSKAHKARSYG